MKKGVILLLMFLLVLFSFSFPVNGAGAAINPNLLGNSAEQLVFNNYYIQLNQTGDCGSTSDGWFCNSNNVSCVNNLQNSIEVCNPGYNCIVTPKSGQVTCVNNNYIGLCGGTYFAGFLNPFSTYWNCSSSHDRCIQSGFNGREDINESICASGYYCGNVSSTYGCYQKKDLGGNCNKDYECTSGDCRIPNGAKNGVCACSSDSACPNGLSCYLPNSITYNGVTYDNTWGCVNTTANKLAVQSFVTSFNENASIKWGLPILTKTLCPLNNIILKLGITKFASNAALWNDTTFTNHLCFASALIVPGNSCESPFKKIGSSFSVNSFTGYNTINQINNANYTYCFYAPNSDSNSHNCNNNSILDLNTISNSKVNIPSTNGKVSACFGSLNCTYTSGACPQGSRCYVGLTGDKDAQVVPCYNITNKNNQTGYYLDPYSFIFNVFNLASSSPLGLKQVNYSFGQHINVCCSVKTQSCVSDSDCSNGQLCDLTTNSCYNSVPQTEGSDCNFNIECISKNCTGNLCVPSIQVQAGCTSNSDCNTNQVCSSGSCKTAQGGSCTTSSECLRGVCTGGSCEGSVTALTGLSCSEVGGTLCNSNVCQDNNWALNAREVNCCLSNCTEKEQYIPGLGTSVKFNKACIGNGQAQITVVSSTDSSLITEEEKTALGLTSNPYTEQDYSCGGIQMPSPTGAQTVPGYSLFALLISFIVLFGFYLRRELK